MAVLQLCQQHPRQLPRTLSQAALNMLYTNTMQRTASTLAELHGLHQLSIHSCQAGPAASLVRLVCPELPSAGRAQAR